MVAGCAPLLLAIKETMGIGGTRQKLEHPEGVEPYPARLGRPATRPACWNAKAPARFHAGA